MTKQDDQKKQRKRKNWLTFLSIFVLIVVQYGLYPLFNARLHINQKIDNTPTQSDLYFKNADPQIYQLARKIERKEPITLGEVKALPEGALNKRYKDNITWLFFALNTFNAQAIDVLLEAGADPYMVDLPGKSKRDFTYYFFLYDPDDKERFTADFVNSNIRSYLKHGGDPNHSQSYTIMAGVASSRNYEGVRLLAEAGADLFADGDSKGLFTAVLLARNSFPEGQQFFGELIDQGYLNEQGLEKIKKIIRSLIPTGDGRPIAKERNALAKLNAEKLLRQYPDIQDGEAPDSYFNKCLRDIFDGPVPWKDILNRNDTN